MRKISIAVIVILVSVLVSGSALAEGHRVGAGLNFSSPSGVADDGSGGYISHMYDISDLLATYIGISHVSGDFALTEEGVEYKGSFTATQIESAFVAQWRTEHVTPYAGLGGGYNYLSFDDMDARDGTDDELGDTVTRLNGCGVFAVVELAPENEENK